MKRWTTMAAITAAAMLTATADAQKQKDAQQREGQRQERGASVSDAEMAKWLVVDNLAEVQFSQFGQEQVQNEQVKAFAKKMVEDHRMFAQKLQQAAQGIDEGWQEQVTQKLQQEPRRTVGFRGDSAKEGQANLVNLKVDLAQRCLASFKQALKEKPQDQADEAFMAMQIAIHMTELDTMQSFASHTSSEELHQTLQQGIEATKQHLEEAKQIKDRLKQQQR